MIYKSFEIKKFKGVDKVSIDLTDTRLITLVGLNESGKTTIMEAIYLFYQMIKGVELGPERLNEIRPKEIAFTGSIEIGAKLLLGVEDKEKIRKYWKKDLNKRGNIDVPDEFNYNFEFIFDINAYKETNRTFIFNIRTKNAIRGLYQTNRSDCLKLIEFIKNELVPEILYYDDFIFQIPERICFVKTGIQETEEVIDKNNKIWQSVIADILKSLDDRLIFQNHVVDNWEKDKGTATNSLAQMERALDEKITTRWSALFGKNKVNFREIKLESEYAADKLYLTFKIRTQAKKEFLVKERSKGFKWFFSFLLFTEFRKKRTKNILFLLDEPASNLHSSAQTKILEALRELSNDALVIYSTHSHHLIKPEWLMGAYICINESLSNEVLVGGLNLEDGAKITAVKYYTYVGKGLGNDNTSYFQPILDKLDYQPSMVEPIPDIIILEGKNDWYTFRYFEKIILKKNKTLNFYPGAGKDKLYDIIRLYLSWGRSFLVLLDGDDGVKSKEQYIKEFGEYVRDKIFTLQDVLNKAWTTEELISVNDQKTIYDTIFGVGSYNLCNRSQPKKLKDNLNYALNQLQ